MLAVAAPLCSCKAEKNDPEKISKIPAEFVEAFKEHDGRTCEKLADGFDYDDVMEDASFRTEEMEDIYDLVLSFTEVEKADEPDINEKNGTANMGVEISYLDCDDLMAVSGLHMTYGEYVEALNGFKDRRTEKFTVYFVFDKDEKTWSMSKKSAKKIGTFLASLADDLYYPADISSKEAEDMVRDLLTDMSEGDFTGVPMDYDRDEFRVFENPALLPVNEEIVYSVDRFAAEYIKYILDHDHEFTVEERAGYYVTLTGKAPSPEELAGILCSDDYLIKIYMNSVRYTTSGMTVAELSAAQSVLLYDTMYYALATCEPVDYKWTAEVYCNYVEGDQIVFGDELIMKPGDALFSYKVSDEQYQRCMEQAITILFENKEISEEEYNSLIAQLYSADGIYEPDISVSPSGFVNQATDVYEYVPDWCDDGSIIYGASSIDVNWYVMHYTEVPDYSVYTIGYNFADDGVRITCYFDEPLEVGDVFAIDWWVNEVETGDEETLLIQMSGMHEVEVFLPASEFTPGDYIEMRIWEEDHKHLVSYVQLYR